MSEWDEATDELRELRRIMLDSLDSADREHFESLTPDQMVRFAKIHLQIANGELRRITLDDGTGVLIDGDCTATDEEIRARFSVVPRGRCSVTGQECAE